jgi:hypothetical protein
MLKATISLVMSVCLSVCPFVRLSVCLVKRMEKSTPTGQILVKFSIWVFFWKSVQKIQFSLKCAKSNGYVAWRPKYFYDNTSLNYLRNKKYFRQTL